VARRAGPDAHTKKKVKERGSTVKEVTNVGESVGQLPGPVLLLANALEKG